MKDYRIEFMATEKIGYRTDVGAESPEEALRIFNDDPDDTESENRCDWDEHGFGGREGIEAVECTGWWDDKGVFHDINPPVKVQTR